MLKFNIFNWNSKQIPVVVLFWVLGFVFVGLVFSLPFKGSSFYEICFPENIHSSRTDEIWELLYFFTQDHLQVPWKKSEFENQFQSVLKLKIQLIV